MGKKSSKCKAARLAGFLVGVCQNLYGRLAHVHGCWLERVLNVLAQVSPKEIPSMIDAVIVVIRWRLCIINATRS